MRKLGEKDFEVLREVFVSGRHSPGGVAGNLIIAIPFQAFVCFLLYVVAADSTYFPAHGMINIVHFAFSAMITVLSIFYMITPIYMRGQKMQYFVSVLSIQNIGGITFYMMGLYFAAMDPAFPALAYTALTLAIGAVVFILTCVRFRRLLYAGAYRRGSWKDEQRQNLEYSGEAKKMIARATVAGAVILGFLIKYMGFHENLFFILLSLALFYAMLFVLPEQLLLLYCKSRFSSFNYDMRGELYPIGFDEKYGEKRRLLEQKKFLDKKRKKKEEMIIPYKSRK